MGTRFIDNLFDNRINTFTALISAHSGLSMRGTDQLVSLLSPFIAGYLGNILMEENLSFNELKDNLNDEKAAIQSDMPAELPLMLEITGNNTIGYNTIEDINVKVDNVEIDDKDYAWLRFFLFVVILMTVIISVILWWESCH